METIVIPGVTPEINAVLTVVVGYLSALLVGPLTALSKKWFNTEGVTTVSVSALLSGLIGVGITIYQATQGNVGWGGVIVALLAFIKSNGDYLIKRQATKGAVEKAVTNPQPLPTVNDDALGRPATPEDFAPSMEVKYGKPK